MPVDATEALEAAALLQAWRGRASELPAHLRAEVERLAQEEPEASAKVVAGRELVVELSPELRALLANLRALEFSAWPR